VTAAEFVDRLKGVRRRGSGWMARCPAHDDRHPSLSVKENNGHILVHCFAGCTVDTIVAALGLELQDLFEDTRTTPGDSRATVQRGPGNRHSSMDRGVVGGGGGSVAPLQPDQEGLCACTLEAYGEAKGLPLEFLRSIHLEDAKYAGRPAIRMPYVDRDGEEQAVRYRIALGGEDKFRWKKRSKLCLYGLPRLRVAQERGFAVLVEGESCTQTLWLHDFPALGLPGAANWRDDRDLSAVEGLETLYVVIEPDKGGEAILEWLKRSALTTGRRPKPPDDPDAPTEITFKRVIDPSGHQVDWWEETPIAPSKPASLPKVKLVSLRGAKDVSELHMQDREGFEARFDAELQRATPYEEHERIASELRARAAWKTASTLAQEPRILDVFEAELDGAGVVGERRLCKLVYLAVTARFLDRFPSIVVKGPSAAGKSWTIEKVLDFFPQDAYYLLTAMSEHALAYGTEPLSHRFLVLFEAAGLESKFASYLVRSLLSEGRVRYETVEKDRGGELHSRLVEREGPSGLIVSTTSVALHPENETRLLSLTATDTSEQTKLVLARLAADDLAEPDFSRWHALQVWLATAEHRVTIPYGHGLAELVPPVGVRLRRDFGAVLALIRAHAILHQAARARDLDGKVIATLEDYAIVRELVVDLVSEGVEATVPPTVHAVSAHVGQEGVSITALAHALHLDKSSASRRWRNARARGYLKNLETVRGKPARIVLADPIPDDVEVLPTVEVLRQTTNPDNPANSPSDRHTAPVGSTGRLERDQPQHTADAEIGAALPPGAPTPQQAVAELTLDEALRDPNLYHVIGIDGVTITIEDAVEPNPTRVLLERHEVGPHAIELWESAFELPPSPEPSRRTHEPAGKLLGTCIRCGAHVGDNEWIFGAWDGERWRFSGRILTGARRLTALRPLLCCDCAVRAKYGLIHPPAPDSSNDSRQ
jgi:hypothetical protein